MACLLIQHYNSPFSLCSFVEPLACLADVIVGFVDMLAGFAGEVLGRRGGGRCQQGKHDVFINNSHCL